MINGNDDFFKVTQTEVINRINNETTLMRDNNGFQPQPLPLGAVNDPGQLLITPITKDTTLNTGLLLYGNAPNQSWQGFFDVMQERQNGQVLTGTDQVDGLGRTFTSQFENTINEICHFLRQFNDRYQDKRYRQARRDATYQCWKSCQEIVNKLEALIKYLNANPNSREEAKQWTKKVLEQLAREQEKFKSFLYQRSKQIVGNLNSNFLKSITGCDNISVKSDNIRTLLTNPDDNSFEKGMLYTTFCIQNNQQRTIPITHFAKGISIAIYKEIQRCLNKGNLNENIIYEANDHIYKFLSRLSEVFQQGRERAKTVVDYFISTHGNLETSTVRYIKSAFVSKYTKIYDLIKRTISNNRAAAQKIYNLAAAKDPNNAATLQLKNLIGTFDDFENLFHSQNEDKLFDQDIRQKSTNATDVNNNQVKYSMDTLNIYSDDQRFNVL